MNILPSKEQVNSALAFFGVGVKKTENPFIPSAAMRLEKSEESSPLGSPLATDHFEKAVELMGKAEKILSIFEGIEEQTNKFNTSIQELNSQRETFQKALDDKDKIMEETLQGIQESITKLQNAPKARKSITGISEVERFEKSKPVGVTMSLSQHRQQISNFLFKESGIEKGGKGDPLLTSAIVQLEGTGTLPSGVIDYLFSKNINIVQ